jgi:acyl dehydratase
MMTLAYASELMTKICGSTWLERGEISVKFTKPVFAGDVVTVRAEESVDGYTVVAKNQDNETLMVGSARIVEA